MAELKIPEKIGPLPTGVVVLGIGAVLGLFVVLRNRGTTTTGAAIPATTAILPESTGGGGGGTTPTTPTTPTTGPTFTQQSVLAAWILATQSLAARTTDPSKIRNRLGASFTGIMDWLTQNPTDLAAMPESVRLVFSQLPAQWYTWIQGISATFVAAKGALIAETGQGYYNYLSLPDLINVLRSYPEFMARHPEFASLLTLPISPESTGTQPPTVPATDKTMPVKRPTLPGGLGTDVLTRPLSDILNKVAQGPSSLPSIPGPGSNPMFTPAETPPISVIQAPAKPTPLTGAKGLQELANNLAL